MGHGCVRCLTGCQSSQHALELAPACTPNSAQSLAETLCEMVLTHSAVLRRTSTSSPASSLPSRPGARSCT